MIAWQSRGAGVYEIVNRANGHRYVGSSSNLRERFQAHLRYLRRGTHHSPYLHRVWDKYGRMAFEFRVLRLCSPEECIPLEQRCLDTWPHEYNVAPVAGNCLGVRHTAEACRKMSAAQKGKPAWNKGRRRTPVSEAAPV